MSVARGSHIIRFTNEDDDAVGRREDQRFRVRANVPLLTMASPCLTIISRVRISLHRACIISSWPK
jgi:hypothetical protein